MKTEVRIEHKAQFEPLLVQVTGFLRLRAKPFRGSNSHLGCYSLPLPFKSHNLYKAKRQSHKDSAISLGAGDGI